MTYRQMLFAYWLPTVGIGPGSSEQFVHVPLTDVLNYRRGDGSLQIDVVNLMGCTFPSSSQFPNPYLLFEPGLVAALTDGSVQALQNAGIKVVMTIAGSGGDSVGWSSIPSDQILGFVEYLDNQILGPAGYDLDGIDIDDEWAMAGTTLLETVTAMRDTFPADKILSKALWNDTEVITALAPYLTCGGIMTYGDDAGLLEAIFSEYVSLGMAPGQMTIGVSAGPIAQGGGFTSIATAQQLTQWQPAGVPKLGMMVWTFSQDIQQFTADPQNQPNLMFPNADDHAWQQAMIAVMDGQVRKPVRKGRPAPRQRTDAKSPRAQAAEVG
jgi:hypothetical protein